MKVYCFDTEKNLVFLVRQTPQIGLCYQSVILQSHTKNVGICTFTHSLFVAVGLPLETNK